jgi:hypothetical protein
MPDGRNFFLLDFLENSDGYSLNKGGVTGGGSQASALGNAENLFAYGSVLLAEAGATMMGHS